MDSPQSLAAAFILGLFSTVHCIGMCGGIIGALSLSLPDTIRKQRLPHLLFISPVSYTHLTLPTTGHECRSRWSPYH